MAGPRDLEFLAAEGRIARSEPHVLQNIPFRFSRVEAVLPVPEDAGSGGPGAWAPQGHFKAEEAGP